MRIAIWHNLPSGGGARALNYHLNGLVRRGHEVELWSCNPTADGFIQIPESVKIHQIELKRHQKESFSDKFNSYFYDKNRNMIEMERHCQACAEQINVGGFDLLFANSCFYYAVPFIGQFVNIKKVLYLGEPSRFFYEAMPNYVWQAPPSLFKNLFRRSYWKAFLADFWAIHQYRVQVREEKINYDSFDKVLVNSVFSAETTQRVFNQSATVCYLGIDDKLFGAVPKENVKQLQSNPYIIGLGNLYINKNPELAVRAVAAIKQNRPTLVWVSNMTHGSYYDAVTKLAKELNVDLQIKSNITDNELISLLQNAICMIYTSNLEPFGFAPLEANACGTPVVAIQEGGVKETIIDGKNGFLCQKNPENLAEKISKIIENPTLRNEIGQSAIENVKKNWSIEASIDRLEKELLLNW
jgi:glycosyltransferase involved in cell wall biosynthesis